MRALTVADLPVALALCAQDPVGSVLAASRLQHGVGHIGGQAWGFPDSGPLEAWAWVGANVVPVNPRGLVAFRRDLAQLLAAGPRSVSSIVGVNADVLGVWEILQDHWSRPREVRAVQHSMVLEGPPQVDPDPRVRPAVSGDFDSLLPACIAMFTEEVGYSPMISAPYAYPERVRWLIETGSSWLIPADNPADLPKFKAEVGVQAVGIGQLQGVWVNPAMRGRGLAAPGIATVAQAVIASGQKASLYVNEFNAPALAAYRAVGFERVGTYATVLF